MTINVLQHIIFFLLGVYIISVFIRVHAQMWESLAKDIIQILAKQDIILSVEVTRR